MTGLKVRQVCVVLTAQCNLRCAYCYQNARRPGSMSWPVLCSAVDLLLSSSEHRVELAFLGGEPLLEFDLFRRAADYAKSFPTPGIFRTTQANPTLSAQATAATASALASGCTVTPIASTDTPTRIGAWKV